MREEGEDTRGWSGQAGDVANEPGVRVYLMELRHLCEHNFLRRFEQVEGWRVGKRG